MLRVYAKIRASLQIFFVLFSVSLLSGCGGGYPWDEGGGIVTNNPDSIPNISWQTSGQRQELVQQNDAIAAAAALPASTTPAAAAIAPARTFTVSLLVPLTGKKADLGQAMLKAAQMALFDIGSANFELVPRDTKSTKEGAVAAATTAVNSHSDLILGPVFAEDLKAVKPVAAAANIPLVSFTTDWALAGDDTYIMGFLPFAQVTRVARYAEGKGHKRFAVFAPQTEYCDAVIRTLQNTNVPISRISRYAAMQTDLSTLVQDFAETSKSASLPSQLDFDVLLLPLGSEGLKSLVNLLDARGINQTKARFIGTGLWDDPALTNNPILFGGWFAAPDPGLRADFEKRFQDNYGAPPLRLSSLAYDATALAAVLARSTTSAGSPYTREALTNPRGFAGIDGIFRFRSDGLSERGLAVLEIQSGRSVVIDRAPTAFLPSGT